MFILSFEFEHWNSNFEWTLTFRAFPYAIDSKNRKQRLREQKVKCSNEFFHGFIHKKYQLFFFKILVYIYWLLTYRSSNLKRVGRLISFQEIFHPTNCFSCNKPQNSWVPNMISWNSAGARHAWQLKPEKNALRLQFLISILRVYNITLF